MLAVREPGPTMKQAPRWHIDADALAVLEAVFKLDQFPNNTQLETRKQLGIDLNVSARQILGLVPESPAARAEEPVVEFAALRGGRLLPPRRSPPATQAPPRQTALPTRFASASPSRRSLRAAPAASAAIGTGSALGGR